MKISIAMATYNGAKYLQAQLDSFVAQTRQPDELVVCDDGSTDNTMIILETFSRVAPFSVRIFQNENRLGFAGNFGCAVSRCNGDLIFLSDQDDFWFSKKIESIYSTFDKDPKIWVVVNDAEITDDCLNPTGLTIAGQTESSGLLQSDFITGCCSAFRKSILPVLLPIPSKTHTHDGWLHLLALSMGCRAIVSESLQYYRRHGNNASKWVTSSTSRVSRWTHMRRFYSPDNFKSDPIVACNERIFQLSFFRERLEKNSTYISKVLPSSLSINETISRTELLIRANEQRRKILRKNIRRRFFSGIKFYLSGGYHYFEGWKSFAKDMLR